MSEMPWIKSYPKGVRWDAPLEPTAVQKLLEDAAAAMALKGTVRPFKQRATAWATNTWLARKLLAPQMTKQVARKAKKAHYPAPYAAIAAWEKTGGAGISARQAAGSDACTVTEARSW